MRRERILDHDRTPQYKVKLRLSLHPVSDVRHEGILIKAGYRKDEGKVWADDPVLRVVFSPDALYPRKVGGRKLGIAENQE